MSAQKIETISRRCGRIEQHLTLIYRSTRQVYVLIAAGIEEERKQSIILSGVDIYIFILKKLTSTGW